MPRRVDQRACSIFPRQLAVGSAKLADTHDHDKNCARFVISGWSSRAPASSLSPDSSVSKPSAGIRCALATSSLRRSSVPICRPRFFNADADDTQLPQSRSCQIRHSRAMTLRMVKRRTAEVRQRRSHHYPPSIEFCAAGAEQRFGQHQDLYPRTQSSIMVNPRYDARKCSRNGMVPIFEYTRKSKSRSEEVQFRRRDTRKYTTRSSALAAGDEPTRSWAIVSDHLVIGAHLQQLRHQHEPASSTEIHSRYFLGRCRGDSSLKDEKLRANADDSGRHPPWKLSGKGRRLETADGSRRKWIEKCQEPGFRTNKQRDARRVSSFEPHRCNAFRQTTFTGNARPNVKTPRPVQVFVDANYIEEKSSCASSGLQHEIDTVLQPFSWSGTTSAQWVRR